MTVTIGIVAHTSRGAAAKELAKTVGAQFMSIDNGLLGCDGNHDAVHRHLARMGADWSVVLEDDAVPVDGFRDQLTKVLAASPASVVSLYLGRQRPPQYQSRIASTINEADLVDAHWLTSSRLLHAVGYAIRTELLPSLLDYPHGQPADERISAWADRVAYCWPSLVDHADVPTIVAHPDRQPRPPGRTAWRVGTREVWTDRSVALTA